MLARLITVLLGLGLGLSCAHDARAEEPPPPSAGCENTDSLEAATCFEARGDFLQACQSYDAAVASSTDDDVLSRARAGVARTELHVATVELTLTDARVTDLTLKVDGTPRPFTRTLRFEAGPHTIEVVSPGHRPFTVPIEPSTGQRMALEVTLVPIAEEQQGSDWLAKHSAWIIGWSFVGFGVGAGLTGAGLQISAQAAEDSIEDDPELCGDKEKGCTSEGKAAESEAHAMEVAGYLFYGFAGAAGIASAVILELATKASKRVVATPIRVGLGVGSGVGANVSIAF